MKTEKLVVAVVFLVVCMGVTSMETEAAVAQDAVLEVEWLAIANAEAVEHIRLGDEALGSSKYGMARRHYEEAAELIRADGDLPAMAMHREAAAFYFEGMNASAISALDRLAAEAAMYGDVVTQVWALADVAWVQGKAGKKIDMERTVERLQRLMKSPYIPDAVRAEVMSKRLGEVTTMVQPGTQ